MNKKTSIFSSVMLLLGATIGAGLASGQEVVIFFAQYGFVSIFFAAVFFALFAYGLIQILKYGHMLHTKPDFIKRYKSNYLFESCSGVMFLIFSATMLAGAESLLDQIVYKSNFHLWSILILFISLIIIMKGLKWLINVNQIIVPLIVTSSILVCCFSFSASPHSEVTFTMDITNFAFLTVSSILYGACNLMVSSKVTLNLGATIKEKNIKKVAIITSFLMFIIITLIIVALLVNDNTVLFTELPMVYLAFMINPTVGYAYSAIILLCIFTTLLATFFSLKESMKVKIKSNALTNLIACVLIFVMSLFGFESIVRYSYPIIGALGVIMLFNMKNRMSCSECECSCGNPNLY